MVRRSAGFVSKRPHKKSRGGCLTCKRKKVKCDEAQPACAYCALRKLECAYPEEHKTPSKSPSPDITTLSPGSVEIEEINFNDISVEIPSWLVPAATTSSGQLSPVDLELLQHYKTATWRTITPREDSLVHSIHREWIPQMSMSKDYLLYAILSISAAHINFLRPSKQRQNLALGYRQKTFTAYNKALQNITTDNYESILIAAVLLIALVPPPEAACDDATYFDWVCSFLNMMQGLRILASLKWAAGIEQLSVFPMFRRELRTLPPPPMIHAPMDPRLYTSIGPLGTTPEHPDPPLSYKTMAPPTLKVSSGVDMSSLPFRTQELTSSGSSPHSPSSWKRPASWQLPSPVFLPPPLMALLKILVDPPASLNGSIDLHRGTLVPVLHALSPIFLSLYYYHLDQDAYVRIIVFPTFLSPQFLSLVRDREPRALVILAWWFAFVQLLPHIWWIGGVVPRIMQLVSDVVCRGNDAVLMSALDGAYRIVRTCEREGMSNSGMRSGAGFGEEVREMAAKSCFEGWEGVRWEEGPKQEEEWRFGELVNLEFGE